MEHHHRALLLAQFRVAVGGSHARAMIVGTAADGLGEDRQGALEGAILDQVLPQLTKGLRHRVDSCCQGSSSTR